MRNIVVVDIDGTVADSQYRLDRLAGKPWPTTREGWAVWEAGMENDGHIEHAVELVNALFLDGKTIVFVTSREEYMRVKTAHWLGKLFKPEKILWMRANDDKRSAAEVKLELIVNHIGIENVFCCIEDDASVARGFRKAGMYVLHIADPTPSPETGGKDE